MITKKLVFNGNKGSEHIQLESTPFYGEIEISLINLETDVKESIFLDIPTSICLAKTIRTHINLVKELENNPNPNQHKYL